ncbi:hypothetical protein HXX76_016165 [Chlamydomonas incerta]|uniref:Uncharacterized protein n=1 Tax=Chlamydomonas incerta TaxID=51695 RepID=A0A835SKX8_CHLIN|nr:hypothetical protein HXX76_016165 [Chlamydomonas incerta]|eukprot:KAG2422270.1 hypothetical protein HXX76_016165 [Chlamydomonas incerta]
MGRVSTGTWTSGISKLVFTSFKESIENQLDVLVENQATTAGVLQKLGEQLDILTAAKATEAAKEPAAKEPAAADQGAATGGQKAAATGGTSASLPAATTSMDVLQSEARMASFASTMQSGGNYLQQSATYGQFFRLGSEMLTVAKSCIKRDDKAGAEKYVQQCLSLQQNAVEAIGRLGPTNLEAAHAYLREAAIRVLSDPNFAYDEKLAASCLTSAKERSARGGRGSQKHRGGKGGGQQQGSAASPQRDRERDRERSPQRQGRR